MGRRPYKNSGRGDSQSKKRSEHSARKGKPSSRKRKKRIPENNEEKVVKEVVESIKTAVKEKFLEQRQEKVL